MRRDPAAVDRNSKKDKPFNPRKNTGCRCFSFFTIFTFTACVRRFNVWRYSYTAAAPLALWPLFMALWCGVVPCAVACRLRGALPACRRPCVPVALSMAVPDRWRSLCGYRFGSLHAGRPGAAMACLVAKVATRVAGKVAKVAGIVVRFCAKVATKVASVCGKVATKVARFTPKS